MTPILVKIQNDNSSQLVNLFLFLLTNFPIHPFIYWPTVTNSLQLKHISPQPLLSCTLYLFFLSLTNFTIRSDFLIHSHSSPDIAYLTTSLLKLLTINSSIPTPPVLLISFPIPTHPNQYLS